VQRLIKWVMMLAVVGGVLAAVSYVGARATAGQFVGSNPPLGRRTIRFAFGGISSLNTTPRAWVFTYGSTSLPGVERAQIIVSPTGKLLATRPPDLERRLEQQARLWIPAELRED
jgi:hypothetical protein